MVVGFTTIYAISAFHHWSSELETHSWRGVLDTTLCDKVCQWQYNWNIVESGVKHHNPNNYELFLIFDRMCEVSRKWKSVCYSDVRTKRQKNRYSPYKHDKVATGKVSQHTL